MTTVYINPIIGILYECFGYGIGVRPAASPQFPLPLKKSANGQTRKMRPENGQISYKIVLVHSW